MSEVNHIAVIGCLQISGGRMNRVKGERRREILDSKLITSWLVTTREVGLYTESLELSEICLSNDKRYKTIKQ